MRKLFCCDAQIKCPASTALAGSVSFYSGSQWSGDESVLEEIQLLVFKFIVR